MLSEGRQLAIVEARREGHSLGVVACRHLLILMWHHAAGLTAHTGVLHGQPAGPARSSYTKRVLTLRRPWLCSPSSRPPAP